MKTRVINHQFNPCALALGEVLLMKFSSRQDE
jgi:hypothetical protein